MDQNDNQMPLTEEQKKAIEQARKILPNVFARIAPSLTDEDLDKIDILTDEDTDGSKVIEYLQEKVPDFDQIVKEEAERLQIN